MTAKLIGLAACAALACAPQQGPPNSPPAGSGGVSGPTGSGGTGAPGTGGTTPGTGGATPPASGGGPGTGSGGVSATGGEKGSGGVTGTGGAGQGGAGSGGTAGGSGGSGTGGRAGATGGGAGAGGGSTGSAGNAGGPNVDRSNPKLYTVQFTAKAADSTATKVLGNQFAYLDTRVAPKGKLVVYLHGAGDFTSCGNGSLGTLVASWGFHWFGPCYLSNYGVENCGNDIEGCRMEAFEGVDHHSAVTIARPDSIEERIVRGLKYLQTMNPQGDWQYFLDGNAPRWSEIVITGHSHGASSAGVVGVHRKVARVVMLAGPYDPGQAWLMSTPMTARDRFYGFSHTGDSQHSGHLAAWQSLGVPGTPTKVDGAQPPYGNSHRLESSASVSDAHQSVQTNTGGFTDAWRYLYGGNN